MAATSDLRELLVTGTVLGAELSPEYRVLALTVEPVEAAGDRDLRRQVLFHPVGEFAASLRRRRADGVEILTFATDQLPDVVARFEGARPAGDPLPAGRPDRSGWGPRLSLQGGSSAPDGRSRHLHLDLRLGELVLDLHVSFDVAEIRDADGRAVTASGGA